MLSLALVTSVVLLITFNVIVSGYIIFAVILAILYTIASIYLWNLKMNFLSSIHIIFALGIAVDYSVHIAHKYIVLELPDSL